MSTTFAAFEHNFWENAAEAYDRGFGAVTAQTAAPLLSSVHLKFGDRILDIACGPGYMAETALNHGAKLTGVDFAESMVELAKKKYPAATFKAGDAHKLPFKDNSFDGIVCAFGIMHFATPLKAMAESWRVCKPGSRYSYAIWNQPEKSPALQILMGAIQKHAATKPDQPEGEPFFKYADPENAKSALMSAGFQSSTTQEIELKWPIASAEHLISSFRDGGARIGGILRAQTGESLAAIQSDIQSRIEEYKAGKGYHIPVSIFIATGTK